MSDQEPTGNGVRVTNVEIYRLLLDTNARVASVAQTVQDVLKPGLDQQKATAADLAKNKADLSELERMRTRIERVEMRMYAIMSGMVAAVIGGKGLGFL